MAVDYALHLFVLAAIHFGLLEPKPIITGAQPLARREMGRRTCFLVSLGLFRNAKELWPTPFNIRTLLIDNEIKDNRPQQWFHNRVNGCDYKTPANSN